VLLSKQANQNHEEMKKEVANQFQRLRHTPLYLGDPPTASSEASTSHAGPSTPPVSGIPTYKLDRSHSTVMQVWQEYEMGAPGCMAVKDLENQYHTGWRKHPTEGKYFSRRNVLYKELERIAGHDQISLREAAQQLEETRKRHKKTLDTLCSMLKSNSSQEKNTEKNK
jgi:hypothetical protein